MQLVLEPVNDYYPAPQSLQPSVLEVAAASVEYCPEGHAWSSQLILGP